jgi:hypothetical protein
MPANWWLTICLENGSKNGKRYVRVHDITYVWDGGVYSRASLSTWLVK